MISIQQSQTLGMMKTLAPMWKISYRLQPSREIITDQSISLFYTTMNKQTANNRACQRPPRAYSHVKALNLSIYSTSTKDSSTKNSLRPVKKSVECPKSISRSPERRPIVIPRAEKKVFNLSDVLERERQRQLLQIKQSIALIRYYNSLLLLFTMLYTSSQVIASNFFSTKARCYPELGIRLVDTLLKLYSTVKHWQLAQKLNKLATNILRIASTPSQFERKAQFISRKVTLNFEKKKEIESAAMNIEVESFWQAIVKALFIRNQSSFLADLFESHAEKLCLRDFQSLIDKYLSTDLFQIEAKDYAKAQSVPNRHSFTIEFLLIEKICTGEYVQMVQMQPQKEGSMWIMDKKKYCQIY